MPSIPYLGFTFRRSSLSSLSHIQYYTSYHIERFHSVRILCDQWICLSAIFSSICNIFNPPASISPIYDALWIYMGKSSSSVTKRYPAIPVEWLKPSPIYLNMFTCPRIVQDPSLPYLALPPHPSKLTVIGFRPVRVIIHFTSWPDSLTS